MTTRTTRPGRHPAGFCRRHITAQCSVRIGASQRRAGDILRGYARCSQCVGDTSSASLSSGRMSREKIRRRCLSRLGTTGGRLGPTGRDRARPGPASEVRKADGAAGANARPGSRARSSGSVRDAGARAAGRTIRPLTRSGRRASSGSETRAGPEGVAILYRTFSKRSRRKGHGEESGCAA